MITVGECERECPYSSKTITAAAHKHVKQYLIAVHCCKGDWQLTIFSSTNSALNKEVVNLIDFCAVTHQRRACKWQLLACLLLPAQSHPGNGRFFSNLPPEVVPTGRLPLVQASCLDWMMFGWVEITEVVSKLLFTAEPLDYRTNPVLTQRREGQSCPGHVESTQRRFATAAMRRIGESPLLPCSRFYLTLVGRRRQND